MKKKEENYQKKDYKRDTEFAEHLKYAMFRRGVTNQELADAIFASASAISGYRTGRRTPSFGQLVAIAKYLNVTIDYLLGAKDWEG